MANESSIFRSLKIIESRISEKLTIDSIAKSVYFSKHHYQRLFRETVGDSVMEYVTKRKLTLAGKELIETSMTILDIALKYGFDSHEGFTRSFKSYMGVTPTDYRKFNLSTISQKTVIVKEKYVMTYSKTTDEIIRELNGFIAKAQETATYARKSEASAYSPFWNRIADITEAMADRTKSVLKQIASITENPDEITIRFSIMKILDDITFESKLIGFNVSLMVSRAKTEYKEKYWPLCGKFGELTHTLEKKREKIIQYFNGLSSLIFEDMQKNAEKKMKSVVEKGKTAIEGIKGYSYIKDEIANIVKTLSSVSVREITVSQLEDYSFRMNIVSFAADVDIFRNPNDKSVFDGIATFKESLSDAISFFKTIIKLEDASVIQQNADRYLMESAYQGCILLFYFRGEIEKLDHFLEDEQKRELDSICDKINKLIQFARRTLSENTYNELTDMSKEIYNKLKSQAEKLEDKGGAVMFLASEFDYFAKGIKKRIN